MQPLPLDDAPVFRGIADYKPLNKPKTSASAPKPVALMASNAAKVQSTTFSLAAEARPEAFAVTTEAVNIQVPLSTAPEAHITEDKVSREWWIDDVIQR
jgi:hypothetical protein